MRDLTIEVTAKTTIDRESAERCLKMVEWYCNDNDLVPYANRDPEGKLRFRFVTDTFGGRQNVEVFRPAMGGVENEHTY